jgi:hypothetical membrane protein
MIYQQKNQTYLDIPGTLKTTGIISGAWAIFFVMAAILAYLPGNPSFSFFTTYLSDIGDTPFWPQIVFNAGSLLSVPMRILVIVVFVLRLAQLGVGKSFSITTLVLGVITGAGTVMMTAIPFSTAPTIHKLGIPLYFLGVVVMQTLVGIKELQIKRIPKILPAFCFLEVVVFMIFATLMILLEKGMVNRDAPVIWEWLCFATSMLWVFGHSLVLGKPTVMA